MRLPTQIYYQPFTRFSLVIGFAIQLCCALSTNADDFVDKKLPAFINEYCIDCHGEQLQEGKLRIESAAIRFDQQQTPMWEAILKKLDAGQMPPADAVRRPSSEHSREIRDGLRTQLAAASAHRRKLNGRTMVRRMNRVEYQNTLHDLLSIEVDLKEQLPEDPIAEGFDNVDEALRFSPVQMERYLSAAETALSAAIVTGSAPTPTTRRLVYKEINGMKEKIQGGRHIAQTDDAVVLFHSGYTPYEPRELWSTPPGKYRIRISAYGYQTAGKPAVMCIYFGNFNPNAGRSHLVGYFDVKANEPTVIEFEDRFVARGDSVKPVPYGGGDPWRNDGKIQEHTGPGLAVQWIEVEGPIVETWPPKSQRRLFGEVDLAAATPADAERLLRAFLPRAFRRPITSEELAHFVSLANAKLTEGKSFEQAMRFAYKAVLCSPNFLILGLNGARNPSAVIATTSTSSNSIPHDYFLASRLSYFLWNSQPDDELFRLARDGQLSHPETLRAQVERMLNSPKADRFIESFTGQWLGLRSIDFTTPDKTLYPEFDEFLQTSMVGETQQFFAEILRRDLSILNFVDSDWAMLNGRLATLYGIPDVSGATFRKVPLLPEYHRGGVLTQASILKITANGTNTSPVIRGAWVLDRILGTPAPPPPANVPAVEPDIRGATTIRELLAKHRSDAACNSCHRKMDPAGFALENFDVLGGWREHYRVPPDFKNPRQKRLRVATTRGERSLGQGPTVDASDELEDGRKFNDIADFKRLLLSDPDQIARSLTSKLLVYSTGHPLETVDQTAVAEIVQKMKPKSLGLRSLLHEIVQHPAFKDK